MKIYRTEKIIKREKLKENPDVLYIFGDNDIRKGLGGQAKEMRGEPNAFGISTKKFPSNNKNSFKKDEEYIDNCKRILDDINEIKKELISKEYKALVIPQLGVGLANLPLNAPKTYKFLIEQLNELENFCKLI